MRKLLLTIIMTGCGLATMAQKSERPFHAYLYNKEYKVCMQINFYENDIIISGQDMLGPLPGYLGHDRTSFHWPIVSACISGNKATMQMVNDYGSEDLEAQLTCEDDSTYVLKQLKGSSIKMPENGKWQKLPRTIMLKRR